MAKKKRVRRSTAKNNSKNLSMKIGLTERNSLLFLVLSLASYLLYRFSDSELFLTFFGILSIIFSFLTLAFLISFIVLFIVKKRG